MPTASPAAAAEPWLVPLVVVLIVAGAVLIAGALAVAARRVPARGWRPFSDDDLPRFAAAPPGFGEPTRPGSGATTRPGCGATTGSLAVVGVLVLLAAATVTVVRSHAGPPPTASAAQPGTTQLRFGGVVLQQRAVGVTVTYPEVTVRTDSHGTAAHLRLPTFNCLADAPPAEPLAAGCVRSLEEFADLRTPRLSVVRGAGGTLRLSGRFPTYVKPSGSPPEFTGRAYALTMTSGPGGATTGGGFRLEG